MRILLDTNVLVAAFATRGFCFDLLHLVLAEHRLIASEAVLNELERILAGKLRMPDARVAEVVGFVREHADVAAPVKCVFRCKPITDSGANRSLIPVQTDHRFRSKPITPRRS